MSGRKCYFNCSMFICLNLKSKDEAWRVEPHLNHTNIMANGSINKKVFHRAKRLVQEPEFQAWIGKRNLDKRKWESQEDLTPLFVYLLFYSFIFQEVKANPNNYDAWFDYLRLMESESDDLDAIREVYERSIANIPPIEVTSFLICQIFLDCVIGDFIISSRFHFAYQFRLNSLK